MKHSLAISLVLCVGCGSSTPAQKPSAPTGPAPEATLAPGWARAGVLRGDWRLDDRTVPASWLRPGGPGSAIYGVDLEARPNVMVIDDEPVDRPAEERTLQIWSYQDGKLALTCTEHPGPSETLAFTCDGGATFRFWENGSVLDFEVGGPIGAEVMHLLPIDGVAAPELEEADRQFARDTAARGAKGWVSWFADNGEQWRGDKVLVGHEAIEAKMTGTLAAIQLDWEPTVSRLAPDGQSGYTAGTSLVTVRETGETERGTYVTLWNKTKDGWKVRFDVGRSDP